MSSLKLGKQPATPRPNELKLARYLTPDLPPVPPTFGHMRAAFAPNAWPILGNDRYGCCVEAWIAKQIMVWTAVATGTPARFTEREVLNLYHDIAGFNEFDPATDVGTNMRDALDFWYKHGVKDADGRVHRILAHATIDVGNTERMKVGRYLFCGAGIGVALPQSAMDQYNADEVWEPVYNSPMLGGHCVGLGDEDADGPRVLTWIKEQPVSDFFLTRFNDEAHVALSEDMLEDGHLSLEGFPTDKLIADMTQIATGGINQ